MPPRRPDPAITEHYGWDQSIRVERLGKYRLVDPYTIYVDIPNTPNHIPSVEYLRLQDGFMCFEPGFLYDGPSGPALDTQDAMRGALVHDGGYRLIAYGELSASWREYFDWLYRMVNVQAGMRPFRAMYHFHAVRRFGGEHLTTRQIQTYP